MKGFCAPNYTQVPNDYFELIMEMTEAENKVLAALLRATFGYHRDEIKLSIRELASITKMSTSSVWLGAQRLQDRGLIEKTVSKIATVTTWRVVISDTALYRQIVKTVSTGTGEPGDKESKETKKESAPAAHAPDLVDGILKYEKPVQTLISAIAQYFPFNVNWRTKTSKQWLEWAHQEGVTAEQLKKAAEVWRSDKRFNWGQPNLQRLFENWPALMGKDMNTVDESVHVQWQQEVDYE